MKKVIDTKEIQTAADLLQYFEEIEALGYDLDTIYLYTQQADVNSASFVEERLSDGSLVWNVAINP